jgi:hypothetical protein
MLESSLIEVLTRVARGLENLVETLSLAGPQPSTMVQAPASAGHWSAIANHLGRIADVLAPLPKDKVGTPYVAKRLGCTTVWVAEMVRLGRIPQSAIVPGTGNGKPWKFFFKEIDKWLESR